MALSIQERLKDLRVERRLTLEQLAEQIGLSKSALGSYKSDDYKDISHHAINRLANFYGVTTDYLLARTEVKKTVKVLEAMDEDLVMRVSRIENHLGLD